MSLELSKQTISVLKTLYIKATNLNLLDNGIPKSLFNDLIINVTKKKHDDLKLNYEKIRKIQTEKQEVFDILYGISTVIWNVLADGNKNIMYPVSKTINLNPNGSIIITMTSCKRLDLLKRTINSMTYNIEDIESFVKQWYVIDDNSTKEDREYILNTYPFITLIEKDQQEKGHPRSMNIIHELITKSGIKYNFHVEDDFEFFVPIKLDHMIKILEHDSSLGQVLVNANYSEDPLVGSTILGSVIKYADSIRYLEHRYYTGKQLESESMKLQTANCLYWPHFSFRPSLIRSEIYNRVGTFNEKAQHFEMEYAQRYISKGYKSAFLDGLFCTHIGRRTYERNTEKLNAYDLNQESQFGEKIKTQDQTNKTEKLPNIQESTVDKTMWIDTSVINLKRRPERLAKFVKENNNNLISFRVFDGIDGKNLKPNFKLQKLFSTGDFSYRRGIVGCALSHIALWKELAMDNICNMSLIFEDDAKLVDNFSGKCLDLITTYKDKYDLMFLHYLPWPQYYDINDLAIFKKPKAEKWTKEECIKRSMGGATAYILTKKGAITLLEHIDKYGVYNGIDWVMFKCADEMNIMYSRPMLVHAECVQTGQTYVDSDIQRDFDTCGYKDDWTKMEINELMSKYSIGVAWGAKNDKFGFLDNITNSKSNNILLYPEFSFDIQEIDTNICVFPKTQTKLPMNKTFVWYTTDKYLFTVPHHMADDKFLSEHTLGNHMLNRVNII